MAKTSYGTSANETRKVWEEKLFRDSVKTSYFNRFMGEGQDKVVQVKTELEKSRGDSIRFGIRYRATGDGVEEGVTLEGKEEKLNTATCDVLLKRYRHAIRDDGEMTRQRAMFDVLDEQRSAIEEWGAEKIDKLCFDELFTGTPAKVFYKTTAAGMTAAAAATAKAALVLAESKMTPEFISFVKAWALTGGGRNYVPLRPILIDGKKHLVLLVSPDTEYDIKVNSTFSQAVREAEVRGKENPLFTGAVAIWDGVVIHSHENVPQAADGGGAAVPWAKAALVGAQSLCFAWGKRPSIVKKDFDYDEEVGFAWRVTCGVKRPEFNSKIYGSVPIYVSRTNVSGA